MPTNVKARPGARTGTGRQEIDERRSGLKHSRGSRQRGSSPWGELYGELLGAERRHRGYMAEQHRAAVERRARQAVELLDAAHEANQARRARVLRHPDLADRVRAALRLTSAGHWNGYVPPRTLAEPACRACAADRRMPCHREHAAAANTSQTRAELVDIDAEAKRREDQGD